MVSIKSVLKTLRFTSKKPLLKLMNVRFNTIGGRMIYGYVRISTPKQSLDRQIRNIKAVEPNAVIVEEKYTGTTLNRPEWMKFYNRLKFGDTIYFDSVSRMSRNAKEGFKLYQELFDKGIILIFLKEPHINTEIYKKSLESRILDTGMDVDIILKAVRQYLMRVAEKQIQIAFEQAEKEVIDLRQRTKEGIESARLRGKRIGMQPGRKLFIKKKAGCQEAIKKYSKYFNGSLNDKDVIKLVGLSRNTYYKYKKELKGE